MLVPPPVSGQTYPVALISEERSNYLRGGLSFTGAYTDNALGTVVNGHPLGDESYSVSPTIDIDETTSRVHYRLTYSPGFTFYQHTTSRNEADHDASVELVYRLTPHVTISAKDGFQKSSNIFDQPPDVAAGGVVSGGSQGPNLTVIAPISDRLSNLGNVGVTYQFGLNDMIGADGTFFNLKYGDPAQVAGLHSSSSQSGLAFYSHRISKRQYAGMSYAYQRLLAYQAIGANETLTHAALAFYTLIPIRNMSFSIFGGPQYSSTAQFSPPLTVKSWTPAAGVSLGWQGKSSSFALSYSHIVASGGGLVGAVQFDSASASIRQKITRGLSGSVSSGYAQSDLLGKSPLLNPENGHTIYGAASLQQQIGRHLQFDLGYARIRQVYGDITFISSTPNTNRESIAMSYQFSKALGR